MISFLVFASSEAKNLPEWGFKQHEVSCKKKDFGLAGLVWNIESHENPSRKLLFFSFLFLPICFLMQVLIFSIVPDNTEPLPRPGFLSNFLQLNFAMIYANNALVPDPTKVDILASKPSGWPFMREGIRMTAWSNTGLKLYLVGNPIVWWLSTVGVAAYGLFWLLHDATQKRGRPLVPSGEWDHFKLLGGLLLGGYLLHYLPFLVMGRVTYLHHYLPALYFAILIFAFLFDHLLPRRSDLSPGKRLPDRAVVIAAVVILAVLWCFYYFFPLPYGYPGSITSMAKLKWISTWNIA